MVGCGSVNANIITHFYIKEKAMSLMDEIEFERLEPKCACCGKPLTFEEWELDEICEECYNLLNSNN